MIRRRTPELLIVLGVALYLFGTYALSHFAYWTWRSSFVLTCAGGFIGCGFLLRHQRRRS